MTTNRKRRPRRTPASNRGMWAPAIMVLLLVTGGPASTVPPGDSGGSVVRCALGG